MTITIELTREQEVYVTAIARERGVAVQDIVAQLIEAQLIAAAQMAASQVAADQRRLHALLQYLFKGSDALERRPGSPANEGSASHVAEAIREKYRAQGLRV